MRSKGFAITNQSQHSAFDVYHPSIPLGYFAALVVMCMAAMQPVYLLISFGGALVYSFIVRGWRATLQSLAWQMPLVVVIALVNPLFSASGSTELFRIGLRAFYLESFVYGGCMGLMLASMLLVFSNAAQVVTSDKIMALMGNAAPTIGLMMSMTARLVPQFVRRGRAIAHVQQACTAATSSREADAEPGKDSRKRTIRSNVRLTSVLMGWSMEDSLETANAMKARGWGVGARRSTYARFRFRSRDARVLGAMGALLLVVGVAAGVACVQFHFYPTLGGFAPWFTYLPYLLYVALPLILEVKDRIRWSK